MSRIEKAPDLPQVVTEISGPGRYRYRCALCGHVHEDRWKVNEGIARFVCPECGATHRIVQEVREKDRTDEGETEKNHPRRSPAGFVELTSAYDGRLLLLAVELIGEVRDTEVPHRGSATVGRAMLIHLRNRRVSWRVQETYAEVIERIRASGEKPGGAWSAGRPLTVEDVKSAKAALKDAAGARVVTVRPWDASGRESGDGLRR